MDLGGERGGRIHPGGKGGVSEGPHPCTHSLEEDLGIGPLHVVHDPQRAARVLEVAVRGLQQVLVEHLIGGRRRGEGGRGEGRQRSVRLACL